MNYASLVDDRQIRMAQEVVKNINLVINGFDIARPLLQDLKCEAMKLLQHFIDEMGKLGSKGVELRHKARDLTSDLEQLRCYANVFTSKVEEALQYCSNIYVIEVIKGDVSYGIFDSLEEFLINLTIILLECEEKYQVFRDECETFKHCTTTFVAECERVANETDTKKTLIQAGGGTVAGGLLATAVGSASATGVVGVGGIAASVIAGIPTLGIGTVVGLVATGVTCAGVAGASGTAGVITAVITAKTANRYDKCIKELRRLASTVDNVHVTACSLVEHLIRLKWKVNELRNSVTNLEGYRVSYNTRTSICKAIQLLNEKAQSSLH